MPFREPAPNGAKGDDNLPVLVLPNGAILKDSYKVTGYIAAGGMSIIYSALRENEKYLIKEVDASDPKNVIALNQEKFTLERLQHPGIISVYDLFEQDGFYYLVLEYIEGESMERLISPFPDVFIQEKIILDWALQLCDILEYLHKQSPPVIYRDLKPKNLLKDKSGKLHLIDFGIARSFKQGRTRDTEAMGSALTASPEHYGGAQTDERSDIYTLGATLNFFLTNGRGQGDEPFVFASVRSINPKISENMDQVIRKALEIDPKKRYQSIREMRQALLNTRETPLPLVEPFGKRAESNETSTLSEGQDERTGSVYKILTSVALIILGILMVFVVVHIVTSGARKEERLASHTSGSAAVSPSVEASIGPSGTTGSVVTTVTVIYQSGGPSGSPSGSPMTAIPSPTLFVTPSKSPPGTVAQNTPPDLKSSGAYPTLQNSQNSQRQPSNPGEDPGQQQGGNQSQKRPIPTMYAGEKFQENMISMVKVYRDNKNSFEIIIPPGWVADDKTLEIAQTKQPGAIAGFAHLPHPSTGMNGPDIAIILSIEKRAPGMTDPRSIIEKWNEKTSSSGEQVTSAEQGASPSSDRVIQPVVINGRHSELRSVCVGTGSVAFLRAIPIGRNNQSGDWMDGNNVVDVLVSFSFIGQ